VTSATKDAAFLRQERMDVPGADKVLGCGLRIGHLAHRPPALLGRNARADRAMIDRREEAGLQRGRVRLDNGRQFQPLGNFRQDGGAEFTPAGDQKVDAFDRCFFRRTNKIPFVFPVLGVDNDNHLAAGQRIDGILNFRELAGHVLLH
jgi:hypothetical protein